MRRSSRFFTRKSGRRRPRGRATRLRFEGLEQRKLLTTACGDFNGDGYDDLAIGVPYEDVQGVQDAGAVNVIYGSPVGLHPTGFPAAGVGEVNQLWHQNCPGIQDSAEENDHFGSALMVGDFNGDGYDDLAIGVPDEDLGAAQNAGAVHVLYGSADGLTEAGDQFWHQANLAILGGAEEGDHYGFALAAGDFDGDGYDDLAIGVPGEDLEQAVTIVDAGVVNVLYGTGTGLLATDNQVWHQNSPGILGGAEEGDQFGYALAAGDFDDDHNDCDDLAIGVPGEDLEYDLVIADAGAVNVIYGSPAGLDELGNQVWHQNKLSASDGAEIGDHFGMALAAGNFDGDRHDDLAVGVPYEDLEHGIDGQSPVVDAGAVDVIYGLDSSGLGEPGNQFWHQDSPLILGVAEEGDHFGWALAAGNFNHGNKDPFDDLAIGVPGDDVNTPSGVVLDAGAVNVLYGSPTGLGPAGNQLWHQDLLSASDGAEMHDWFGWAVAAGDFDGNGRDDLAVGVPGESLGEILGAGAVDVIYGSLPGLGPAGNQFWHQDKPGIKGVAQPFDRFGWWVA